MSFRGRIEKWRRLSVARANSSRSATAPMSASGKLSVFGNAFLDRPSLSGKCTSGQYLNPGSIESNIGGTKSYINSTCFTDPAVYSADDPTAVGFGNAGVGILQGPGQRNFDLSLIKKFPFPRRESGSLEFRSELFNAFNHPQFGDPDVEFTSPTFGQISTTVVNPRVVQFALKLNF